MIRPLEGTSPPVEPTPQPPTAPGKPPQKPKAAPLGEDHVRIAKLATAPKTLSLKAPPDTDVRKLVNDAQSKVLLVTETVPTVEMVKLLSKAAKRDLKVEVRFQIPANESDVTRAFREDASAKLRDAGAVVTWGGTPKDVKTPPNASTASGRLWVDY